MARTRLWQLSAAAVFAAAFGVSGPVAAQQANSAWSANDDDFLLLQLQVGKHRLSQDVRGYQTDQGVCLDLADVIQSLDLPVRLDKKSRRATGWLFSEDRQFTLDRAAGTVQNVNSNGAPLGNAIYDTPEGWCVDTDALGRWFGIEFSPDLFNSSVRLVSDEPLPFIEAIERRSRAARLRPRREAFDLSKFPSADMEYRVWRTPSVDTVVKLGVSGSSGSMTTDARIEAYAAGEVGGASYTARLATDSSLQPASLRFRAYRYARDGGLLGPLNATQVAAGDVETLAGNLTGQTAVGRGVFVSNQPLGRGSRFSSTTLRGTLPAGWDAELYRNGQLLAFQDDSEDGRYEFADIDLFYGQNDLEVVLYGPQGQIRRERADVPVGTDLVEPGKTYYWAGILEENTDLITLRKNVGRPPDGWRWGVGVERGLDDRTSVALGLQGMQFAGRRRRYIEGSLVRTLGPAQFQLGAAHEWGAGAALQGNVVSRLGPVNLSGRAVWVQGSFASEFVSPNLRHAVSFSADTSLKMGKFRLPLQVGVGQSTARTGEKVTEWLMRTATGIRGIRLTAELQGERRGATATSPSRTSNSLRLLANGRVFGVRMRGSAGFGLSGGEKGLNFVRLATDQDLTEDSELRFEAEYRPRGDDVQLRAGYAHRFKHFSIRADGTYSTTGNFGANLNLAFSFGPNPAGGGVRFSNTKLARFGQAAVTVFRDENGDGRLNGDEEVLEGVGVEAGFRSTDAVTNEDGTALVDELKPFAPVLVGIDESTLDDPYLVPSSKGIVVTPRPGVSANIMLAVSPSGEVEGSLQSDNGTSMSGIELELVDARGAVIATTISEFDGFFLFDRVAYGEYRLRVASASAKLLQIKESLGPPITLNRDNDIARMGVVVLQPETRDIVQAPPVRPEGSGSSP